jgi:hypothetical protein
MVSRKVYYPVAVVVVAGLSLSAATETGAEPPRACTLSGGVNIRVQAGPVGGPFPEIVECPIASGLSGQCLRWRWTFTQTAGSNISLTALTFDTDLIPPLPGNPFPNPNSGADIVMATASPPASCDTGPTPDSECTVSGFTAYPPGQGPSEVGGLGANVFDVRVFKFAPASPPSVGYATVFTTPGVGTGTVTAAGKVGSKVGYCAIAGPDNPSTADPKLSQPDMLVTNTLGCSIVWTQSPDGCVVAAEVVAGSCQIVNQQTNPTTTTATCNTEISTPGSCKVCKWNSSLRTYTCVTSNFDANGNPC